MKEALAELAVRVGANVQPGQVVRLSAEVGHAPLVRAVAESAYCAGARFVDVKLFDPLVQRARIEHAPADALEHVPGWEIARIRELADGAGAAIKLTGPTAPGAFDDLDPERAGQTSLPAIPAWRDVELLVNWTVVPAPTLAWAQRVHPDRDDPLAALWADVAVVCRLDEPDPGAAWRARLTELGERAAVLNAMGLDAVRLYGPGTDLTIGLLPDARWAGPAMRTARGIDHIPNLPTEEVFTVPDPERVDGHARLTKPVLVGGRAIDGVTLEFRGGELSAVDGPHGIDALRAHVRADRGAGRLGELALVDRDSRVARLGRTFGVILLDENAASHIALGYGFPELVEGGDGAHVNQSAHHLDVMVGSDALDATGIDRAGHELPLLRAGRWIP